MPALQNMHLKRRCLLNSYTPVFAESPDWFCCTYAGRHYLSIATIPLPPCSLCVMWRWQRVICLMQFRNARREVLLLLRRLPSSRVACRRRRRRRSALEHFFILPPSSKYATYQPATPLHCCPECHQGIQPPPPDFETPPIKVITRFLFAQLCFE